MQNQLTVHDFGAFDAATVCAVSAVCTSVTFVTLLALDTLCAGVTLVASNMLPSSARHNRNDRTFFHILSLLFGF